MASWQVKIVVATCLSALVAIGQRANADLVAGDVAILGMQSDNTRSFAWVPLVDLEAGTQIYFTDNNWKYGELTSAEGYVTFTTPSGGIQAGAVQLWSAASAIDYTSTGSFLLSNEGDQLFAYVGNITSPTFLFGVQTSSTEFQENPLQSADSQVPSGLIVGFTALAVGNSPTPSDEVDNARYNGEIIEGSREELLAAIANADNWEKSNLAFDDLTKGVAQYNVESVAAVPEASSLLVGGVVALASLIGTGIVGFNRRRPTVAPAV